VFLQAALAEARQGLAEGGIPIGSVLIQDSGIIGRGDKARLTARGVAVSVVEDDECVSLMREFTARSPEPGNKEIGVEG